MHTVLMQMINKTSEAIVIATPDCKISLFNDSFASFVNEKLGIKAIPNCFLDLLPLDSIEEKD